MRSFHEANTPFPSILASGKNLLIFDPVLGEHIIIKDILRRNSMKAKRYTEEQIIAVLKEGEAGASIGDLCRKYGISNATYYNWKARYAGMTVSDVRRLKSLETENRRLKQIVAEQALDNRTLKELLSKNF
jgi:putative transposase